MTKKCQECEVEKELTEFYPRIYKDGTVGHRAVCIPCNKSLRDRWRLANKDRDNERNKDYNRRNALRIRGMKLRKYWLGTTWNEALDLYNVLLEQQGGACRACSKMGTKSRPLHVDHCHGSLKVRGLLCFVCNSILGQVKDDKRILLELIAYLARNNNP